MAVVPDYKTGTASVQAGTRAVTGAGTAWKLLNATEALVRPGDWFGRAGLWVPIESVEDDTHLTLAEDWPGATLANSSYRIRFQPDGSRYTAAARAVVEMLANGILASLAAQPGAADKMPFFTGPNTLGLTTLTAAARSLLDDPDIAAMRSTLDLPPSTAPLQTTWRAALDLINQASLTDTTPNRVMKTGAFGLGKSLILVSPNLADVRASGTYYCNSPTGGPSGTTNGWLIVRDLDPDYASQQFIDVATGMYWENLRYAGAWRGWRRQMNEFGTNGNGSYLRFPDGTQMCWGTISTGVSANTQFTDTGQMPWAAAFSAIPRFFASALGNYGNQVLVASPIGTTASAYSVRMINAFAANNTAGTATAVALAIGRWF